MSNELSSAFSDALRLKYLIDWSEKPSTMNQVLTVKQLKHRGYTESVMEFLEMQEYETLMVEN